MVRSAEGEIKERFEHFDTVVYSPYHYEAIQAWVATAQEGGAFKRELSFAPDDRLIVLSQGYEGCSLLVWRYAEEERCAYVLLGYTRPQNRRCGYYQQLYAELRREAKARGAQRIVGGIMSTNKIMLELAAKQGRKATVVWVEEVL